MKTNKTIIELLKVTKENVYGKRSFYALQDLHNVYGFDFCKPYIAKIHEGAFTQKSIAKEFSLDYDKFIVVAIMKRYGSFNVVRLTDSNVVLPASNAFDTLSTFYAKCDFNDARKNADKVYIIAQKKEFLTKTRSRYNLANPVSIEKRYISLGGYNGLVERGYPKEYKYKVSCMEVDKSGYPVELKHDELYQKARDLRREREKAKYNAMTNTRDMIDKARSAIEAKKVLLAQALLESTTYDDIEKIENNLSRWRGLGNAMYSLSRVEERHNENRFRSPDDFNESIADIYKSLNNIEL